MPPPHALHAVVFLVPFLSRADGGLQSDALPVSPDQVLLNATRFALKLGEHTWGKDVKSNLKDNANWKNPDFYKAKRPPAATAPQYEVLEDSWWEQRQWGITLAIDTLVSGRHRMAGPLVTEMNKLKPEVPSPVGFIKAAAGTPYTCGGETVQFDTNVGLPFFLFFFLFAFSSLVPRARFSAVVFCVRCGQPFLVPLALPPSLPLAFFCFF